MSSTVIEEMSEALNGQVPGVAFGFTQPIEMRVDELVAGVKADVAVLLYGDDLEVLARKGKARLNACSARLKALSMLKPTIKAIFPRLASA